MPTKSSLAKKTKKVSTSNKKTLKKESKNVVKKKTVKKIATKKPTSKKTAAIKQGSKMSKASKSNSVKLPSSMSLRSIRKTQAIKSTLEEYTHVSIYRTAYVSAFCFIFVGTALSFSTLFQQKQSYLNTAIVYGTASQEERHVDSSEEETNFELLTDLPDNLQNNLRVNFLAENVDNLSAFLVRNGHPEYLSLSIESILDGKYKVHIDPSDFDPDYYELRITVESLDLHNDVSYSSGKFFMGSKSTEESSTKLDIVNPEIEDDKLHDSKHDEETESHDLPTKLEDADPSIDVSKETEENISSKIFLLDTSSNEISKTVRIATDVQEDFPYFELLARPVNSLDSRFLTLGTKSNNRWIFSVDTLNLPNGVYEFYAESKHSDNLIKTGSLKLVVNNTLEEDFEKSPETHSTTSKTTSTEAEPKEPVREIQQISDLDYASPTNDDVAKKTTALLNDNSGEINDLLKKYAVALQSGDEVLIEDAKKQLDVSSDDIVIEHLLEPDFQNNAKDVSDEFGLKIDSLKERVEVFEKIRNEKSGGATSLDSDNDGVSDYDEVNIYRTNPNLVDSDNDGFNDGIEIIRGFNPTNNEPEASIKFESPKDYEGLVRDDVLEIESVIPLITEETSPMTPTVRAEIRGKGLPNSFVTLFIYSSPTVVTVKTDSDGAFVYTFDKELEDGEHDVYVAVTDNTGSIIAQSSPFSFIKQAEAFSPINSDGAEIIDNANTITTPINSTNIVVGIAIIALGIILLMLGVGLRTKVPAESNHV